MFISSILLIFVHTEYLKLYIYTLHLGVGWLSMIINVLPRYSRHTAIIYCVQAVRVVRGKLIVFTPLGAGCKVLCGD